MCPVGEDEPGVLRLGDAVVNMRQAGQVSAKLLAEDWFARHAVAAGKIQTGLIKSVFKTEATRREQRSPVVAAGHPVKTEKVAVLTGPCYSVFVRRGLASSHHQISKFTNIQANLMK